MDPLFRGDDTIKNHGAKRKEQQIAVIPAKAGIQVQAIMQK